MNLRSVVVLYGRAGRLTAKRRGPRPRQSLPLLAAEVCEKLGQHADALLYAATALQYDPDGWRARGEDCRPTTHAPAHALRGRVLAALGRADEAEAALEAAAATARAHGLRLLEMLALRDLKLHVLDPGGRGADGLRRLRAALQRMEGPAAELTMLLDGLDAEEILRAP